MRLKLFIVLTNKIENSLTNTTRKSNNLFHYKSKLIINDIFKSIYVHFNYCQTTIIIYKSMMRKAEKLSHMS